MDADRPPPPRQLLAAARAAAPKAGATAVIAIDGRAGSGKTTLAAALAAALGDAPVVALEDLYGGWDGLEEGATLLVDAVLAPIAAGAAAQVPRYDWHAGRWGEPWRLAPPPRLIVEGAGAGARAAAPFTSLLVWLEAPAAVRRERLRRRDGDRYGAQMQRWAAAEDAFYERERPGERAGLVLAPDRP